MSLNIYTPLPLIRAVRYATTMHHGQMRSGSDQPYIVHPLAVAETLASHGIEDDAILAAAVLHDVVEDTDATLDDIERRFGRRVAKIVEEVTDNPALSKKQRREYLFAHAHELRHEARLVKVADCISNVDDISDATPEGWSRSLKLAFVKTCERVVEACAKSGGIPNSLLEEHAVVTEVTRNLLRRDR